eukprot:TRINITY_DN1661_c0_g1_i1.p1 TRINITY_DN1661_c0_g1~~TRINITY_DN1661_c0_g1_i1.p1  ORF type:complete len:149 (-),score=17.00 TRINITY_DN1661_c0_g1_i1:34-480(-)
MLKSIPSIISPDLMFELLSMGHGDEIVLADGNFPAASHASRLVRLNGVGVLSLLEAIMKFFPLDQYDKENVLVMKVVPGDTNVASRPPIWDSFETIIRKEEGDDKYLTPIDRFQFYERAKKARCIVATSETAIYANIILKKGVLLPKS